MSTPTTVRTTLSIDKDVLSAARELASVQRRSVDEVISSLVRTALHHTPAPASRNGIPLLPVRPGAPPVSSELVRQLGEELA